MAWVLRFRKKWFSNENNSRSNVVVMSSLDILIVYSKELKNGCTIKKTILGSCRSWIRRVPHEPRDVARTNHASSLRRWNNTASVDYPIVILNTDMWSRDPSRLLLRDARSDSVRKVRDTGATQRTVGERALQYGSDDIQLIIEIAFIDVIKKHSPAHWPSEDQDDLRTSVVHVVSEASWKETTQGDEHCLILKFSVHLDHLKTPYQW